jgi:aldehyde dehydrogenase (NAD+)
MKPHRVMPTRTTLTTRAWIQYQPRGRCLIISPWNYPVNLSFGPLVSAIAAGNTVILKPSEMTPHLSSVIVKITRAVFSEEEVAVFEGDAAVSTALLDLPFDHIFFTGSPAVGKIVMAAAAKNLAGVTLELGGKSPTIIDESADLKLAAELTMWGKFTNNGQTCIAPDHVFVHESVKDDFVGHCREVLTATYGADAAAQKQSPYLARVVNTRHTARIKALLDDARERGAKPLTGGIVDESACYIAPTLITDIPKDARIMQEEIFGPLLPIIPFRTIDEVIHRINTEEKPLALYIWSRDQRTIDKVLAQTSSGGACVNDNVAQFLHGRLPFGGVNNSGIGNAHGHFGFKSFSHERAVIRTFFHSTKMFFPPFTNRVRSMIKLLMRIV